MSLPSAECWILLQIPDQGNKSKKKILMSCPNEHTKPNVEGALSKSHKLLRLKVKLMHRQIHRPWSIWWYMGHKNVSNIIFSFVSFTMALLETKELSHESKCGPSFPRGQMTYTSQNCL